MNGERAGRRAYTTMSKIELSVAFSSRFQEDNAAYRLLPLSAAMSGQFERPPVA